MKKIKQLLNETHEHWVGNGFAVRSLFSYQNYNELLSPFLLLDYAAPRDFPPSSMKRGVGEHPHRGFETVTIVFDGEVAHKDSTGSGGVITKGGVQWMTAGSGIIHEEFHSDEFAQRGGAMEMVQLWVNLPKQDKMTAPKYQGINADDIPETVISDGVTARIIAGELNEVRGPAQTFTPINLWDLTLSKGQHSIEVPAGHNSILLVRSGTVQINDNGIVRAAQGAIFDQEGSSISIEANGDDTKVLLMTGEPINDPVVGYGPFVMNSENEIREAVNDFNNGTFIR
ncbi:pirin family protein [Kangiella sp. M94]